MAVRAHKDRGGFSLVELLVALTFLAIIAVGLVPFLMRSTVNNMTSNETSNLTNMARSTLERYFQADFNDPIVTLTTGTESVVSEYFSNKDSEWKPMPVASGDTPQWLRDVTVRQFAITAIDDGVLQPAEALDASAAASQIALKQIEVYVEGQAGMRAGFGPMRNVTLTLVKSR